VSTDQVRVFRDRHLTVPIIGTIFGGGAAAIILPGIGQALREGGLHITVNGRPEFWNNPWGVLFLVAFSIPFLSVGAFTWLYWLNNKVIVEPGGVRSINLFGRQDFAAPWDRLSHPTSAQIGNNRVVRFTDGRRNLNISTQHQHGGELVDLINERQESYLHSHSA
jgi:hypothetical protein